MKFYKDKDSYVYNKTLYDKLYDKKKLQAKIVSLALAFNIFVGSNSVLYFSNYTLQKSNPFDGQSISSSDFITDYKASKTMSFLEDEDFKDVINSIKNTTMDQKKAYLLYYALLSNHYLTNEEKKNLSGYI